MQQGVKLLQQSKTYSQGPECGQASQVLSFSWCFCLGMACLALSPIFLCFGGSEIKPFSITHLSWETGKGSEELEAAVVVFLLSSWSWMQWGSLCVWGFQAGAWHCHVCPCPSSRHLIPSSLEPRSSRAQSRSVPWALLALDGSRRLPAPLLGLI